MKKNFFKQKVALFFGYKGTSFSGLQKQVSSVPSSDPTPRTVEQEIENALYKCGFISESNFGGEGRIV